MKSITKQSLANPLSFDNGIAGVSFPKKSDPVSTITTGKGGAVSSPASNTIGNITQEKLYASSLDMKMAQFLTPTITMQTVLQPIVYNNSLRSAKKKLLSVLKHEMNNDSIIQSLVAILQEDEELKSLLQMYRNLLYKG